MKTQNEIMEEIEDLVLQATTPEEAIEKILQAYPTIDEKELRKQFEIGSKRAEQVFCERNDSEKAEELSDAELESVAGGSFGSWMKKNWPYVLGVSVLVVGGIGIGIKLAGKPSAQNLKDAKGVGLMQGARQGYLEGTGIGADAAEIVQKNNPETWTQAMTMMGM